MGLRRWALSDASGAGRYVSICVDAGVPSGSRPSGLRNAASRAWSGEIGRPRSPDSSTGVMNTDANTARRGGGAEKRRKTPKRRRETKRHSAAALTAVRPKLHSVPTTDGHFFHLPQKKIGPVRSSAPAQACKACSWTNKLCNLAAAAGRHLVRCPCLTERGLLHGFLHADPVLPKIVFDRREIRCARECIEYASDAFPRVQYLGPARRRAVT